MQKVKPSEDRCRRHRRSQRGRDKEGGEKGREKESAKERAESKWKKKKAAAKKCNRRSSVDEKKDGVADWRHHRPRQKNIASAE